MSGFDGAHFHLTFERGVIVLGDLGTGRSITNSADAIIAELAASLGDEIDNWRIIYRDTMMVWDGLAHRGGTFLGFVPLRRVEQAEAVIAALTYPDWPT